MSRPEKSPTDLKIEYGAAPEFATLAQALGTASRPGSFYSFGSREIPIPTLEVRGVGRVPFPVPVSVAEAIVRETAEKAPFGRGEETVLDESVRKVWQVSPDAFTLTGSGWQRALHDMVEQVRDGLGCGEVQVEAELYKLLIYEKGGHFAIHRDTEKASGMFATLVVSLPSPHSGGTLLVRHAGKEVSLDLCPWESAEIRYAAFYADCEHEVLPVTDGYRICLVYNLLRNGEGEPLEPADDRIACREVARALRQWADRVEDEDPSTRKIVYLLSHKYTEASLSFQALKGADSALARVLGAAAETSDFDLHLAMVHIGDDGYFESWYGYGEEPEEDDMDDAVIDDSYAFLSGWRDRSDQIVDFGRMGLEPGVELLPRGALDGEPPDEVNFYASTGNEGATFDRAYLRAALVLWPKHNAIPIAIEGGPGVMTGLLHRRAEQSSPEDLESLEILAERVLEFFHSRDLYSMEWVAHYIEALTALNFTDVLRGFWQKPLMEHYRGLWNESLVVSLARFSPKERLDLLGALLERYACCLPLDCLALWTLTARHFRDETDALAEGLLPLIPVLAKSRQGDRDLDFDSAPFSLFKSHTLSSPPEAKYRSERAKNRPSLFAPDLLVEFTARVLNLPFGQDLLDALVANPEVFPLETLLYPAWQQALEQGGNSEATAALWRLCASALLRRSEHPPAAPTDWADPSRIPGTSETAKVLVRFLRDSDAQHFAYRAAQPLRSAMESLILNNRLDLDTRTEEKGRPYTLHLSKNRASYRKAVEIHQQDVQRLKSLILPPDRIPPSASELAERCRLAVER